MILCLETATRVCSVALGENGNLLSLNEEEGDFSHSSQLTLFIQKIISDIGIKISDLDAIAVSKGPGSFTGLRIGVSTAKGLCYALDKPLISVGTLQSMAWGMSQRLNLEEKENILYCPMIDARRMEVYTAVYDNRNQQMLSPCAEIINENSFSSFLKSNTLVFAGDGADKCREVLSGIQNVVFPTIKLPSAADMIRMSETAFKENRFEDIASFEPYYLKDFLAGKPKVKGLNV
jgi:tRNA threonylcarbamoyladenosine biosynthesis protein TsaB